MMEVKAEEARVCQLRGEEDDEVGGDEKEAWSCLGRIFSQFINALSGLCHRGTIFRKNCLMDNVKFKESWLCTSYSLV